MLLKPPPEKMTCSHADSGSNTVVFGLTCVAPTEVTNGHTDGKSGLNRVPFADSEPMPIRNVNLVSNGERVEHANRRD